MNLFELFVKIGADTTEANKGIDEVGQKTSGLGEKLKSGLATAGKVAVAGVAAGTAALGTLGTKAVEAYADYEQLVGGVETLFKDSQDQVMDYANNAYKTAGLSANEYMETVTSFSASLLQSLDGDTSAAADKANLAITDMSDNANKMGTDMTSIQNAYAPCRDRQKARQDADTSERAVSRDSPADHHVGGNANGRAPDRRREV